MSFEVFIFSFKNGGPEWFPVKRIRDAFGTHVADCPAYAWCLRYDGPNANGVTLMEHPNDPSLIQGFSVDSPGADIRMWDTLASILASGPFAFVFGSHPPLIGNPEVTQHLPPDMIASMGQPRLVRNGQEILHEIRTA
jgi:hypothetical protein